jgi:hypothetical protein
VTENPKTMTAQHQTPTWAPSEWGTVSEDAHKYSWVGFCYPCFISREAKLVVHSL